MSRSFAGSLADPRYLMRFRHRLGLYRGLTRWPLDDEIRRWRWLLHRGWL